MISVRYQAYGLIISIIFSFTVGKLQPVQDQVSRQKPAILNFDAAIPVSRIKVQNAGFMCPESASKANIQVTFDTEQCLNGDFNANSNIHTVQAPVCADGSRPTFNFYLHQGCKGRAHTKHLFSQTQSADEQVCFWSGPTADWSIIFRCEKAHPTPTHGTVPVANSDNSLNALMVTYPDHTCPYTSEAANQFYMRPDKQCLRIFEHGFEIKKALTCTNGTRAKWARFEVTNCGEARLSTKYSLMDLQDSDIGRCLSTTQLSGELRIRSMTFFCDGPDDFLRTQQKCGKCQQKKQKLDPTDPCKTFFLTLTAASIGMNLAILGCLSAGSPTKILSKIKVSYLC
jgi:hypothetical protein